MFFFCVPRWVTWLWPKLKLVCSNKTKQTANDKRQQIKIVFVDYFVLICQRVLLFLLYTRFCSLFRRWQLQLITPISSGQFNKVNKLKFKLSPAEVVLFTLKHKDRDYNTSEQSFICYWNWFQLYCKRTSGLTRERIIIIPKRCINIWSGLALSRLIDLTLNQLARHLRPLT